jgi:DNA-directed RNA polymerase specialized sigma24 family protein
MPSDGYVPSAERFRRYPTTMGAGGSGDVIDGSTVPSPVDPRQSDGALMDRVKADDAGAFAELYDRHAARAFRVARVVYHDSGHAEDAVQEGFLSVWRQRAQFRPEAGSFQAWSMRIVHSRAIDSHRSAAARPQLQPGERGLPEAQPR